MKKKFILAIALVISAAALSACGNGKKTKTTIKETKPAKVITAAENSKSEADTEEDMDLTGTASLKAALRHRIERWTEIDGTAGASLKTLHQAVMLLKLADAGDYTLDIVSPEVLQYYSSLSTLDQESFLRIWSGVDYYTDTILYDFYAISGMLEDAGDLDTAKELVNSPTIKDKWDMMRRGISGVLPSMEQESSSAEASAEELEKDQSETDEYGHIIHEETDEYGNAISDETDENGQELPETDEYGNVIKHDAEKSEEETDEAVVETLPAETTVAETNVSVAFPTTRAPETTTAAAVTETYPTGTGEAATETFTNVVIVTVDEKLDPSELSNFITKYNLRLIYDYQNFNMYAFACEGVTTQEELDYIMKIISTENHVVGITRDKTMQLS